MSAPILDGKKEPTETHRYLARDGLYYNGYFASPDCAEDFFKEATDNLIERLREELSE